MRGLLLGAVIVGMAWAIPAEAFPLATPGVDNVERTLLTKVGCVASIGVTAMLLLMSTLQLMAIMRLPTHTHIIHRHAATTCLCRRMATIP